MSILWRVKEATVRRLLEELPLERSMAYTSASTIVRILEKKGFVKSEKDGKTHVYSPVLEKPSYEKQTLNHVISNVFNGEASGLVKRLIEDSKISEAELQEIKDLISKGAD